MKALEIVLSGTTDTKTLEIAKSEAVSEFQDFTGEGSTVFIFEDASCLVWSGPIKYITTISQLWRGDNKKG